MILLSQIPDPHHPPFSWNEILGFKGYPLRGTPTYFTAPILFALPSYSERGKETAFITTQRNLPYPVKQLLTTCNNPPWLWVCLIRKSFPGNSTDTTAESIK